MFLGDFLKIWHKVRSKSIEKGPIAKRILFSETFKVEDFPNRGTSASDSSPSKIGTWCIYA